MTRVHDPREELTHDIEVGQVYTDARHEDDDYDERLRIVYVDDERVLLRSNKQLTQAAHLRYMCEFRDTFEENVGSGRYKLVDEPDDPPITPTDGVGTALTVLKQLRSKEEYQYENGGGSRKAKHRMEAFDDAIEAMMTLNPTNIDWSTVDGVGAKTAQNLDEAGFETDVAVQQAEDEQLLDVGGVGQKNLDNIKARAN